MGTKIAGDIHCTVANEEQSQKDNPAGVHIVISHK